MKKVSRILSMAVAAVMSASMLTACQSSERETYFEENSKGEIVDSELLEKIEQESEPLNTHISGDYKQYTRLCGRDNDITMSDKYVYVFWFMGDMGYIKVDLQTGEALPLCDTAGCTHDPNLFPNCINNSPWENVRPVGDALWHTEENKLLQTKDGETKVLYENNYCNEFEKANNTEYKNQKYYICDLIVDDDYVYLFGDAHVTLLDRNTLEEVKTIDFTADSTIYTYDVYDGKIYFVDELLELYVVDIESSECTKMADHVSNVNVQDDIMYYTGDVDGVQEFCSADLDLKNKKKILEGEGIYVGDCVINDGKMIYVPSSKDNTIVCRDIESGEETLLYECESRVLFTGCADFCDRIFFCTESVPDKETLEPYNLLISIRTDGSDLWVKRFDGETWKN